MTGLLFGSESQEGGLLKLPADEESGETDQKTVRKRPEAIGARSPGLKTKIVRP